MPKVDIKEIERTARNHIKDPTHVAALLDSLRCIVEEQQKQSESSRRKKKSFAIIIEAPEEPPSAQGLIGRVVERPLETKEVRNGQE